MLATLSRIIRKIRDGSRSHVNAAAVLAIAIAAGGCNHSPTPVSTAPPSAARERLADGTDRQPTSRVTVSGIVREAGTKRFLRGTRLLVTSGPDAGASAISDSGGVFLFPNLSRGTMALAAAKDGYLVARLQSLDVRDNTTLDVQMYLMPPRNASGAAAMARCKDESWSWAQTSALACTNNGGVATVYVQAPARARDRAGLRSISDRR
jgi:hypothetical protein